MKKRLFVIGGALWVLLGVSVQAEEKRVQAKVVSAQTNVTQQKIGEDSKLPLPRFASLRSRETNLRSGPGKRYPIMWVYKQASVPVEIIDEVQNWRRVRDIEGDSGWLHRSLLSGNRTATFVTGIHNLYASSDVAARVIIKAREGVIVKLLQCTADWCLVEVGDHQGWAQKTSLFGVYSSEIF